MAEAGTMPYTRNPDERSGMIPDCHDEGMRSYTDDLYRSCRVARQIATGGFSTLGGTPQHLGRRHDMGDAARDQTEKNTRRFRYRASLGAGRADMRGLKKQRTTHPQFAAN